MRSQSNPNLTASEQKFLTILHSQRRSVDSLAFETLTPKAIVKRYVSLLLEHKRIILSGPAGTGKTFMANRDETRSCC